jgi:hypothetical protein
VSCQGRPAGGSNRFAGFLFLCLYPVGQTRHQSPWQIPQTQGQPPGPQPDERLSWAEGDSLRSKVRSRDTTRKFTRASSNRSRSFIWPQHAHGVIVWNAEQFDTQESDGCAVSYGS